MDFDEMDRSQQNDDLFDLGTPQQPPKKKKNKKTGLIIGIVAGVVAIAVVIGVLFALGVFNRELTPETLHTVVVTQSQANLYNAADSVAALLGNVTTGQGATGGAKVDMHLLLGEDLLSLLEMTMGQSGMQMDLGWLNDIGISYDLNLNDNAAQILLGLALGQTQVVGMDVIVDDNGMYVGMPGLNPYYMQQEVDVGSFSELTDTMQKGAEIQQTLLAAMPDEATLQKSLRGYMDDVVALLQNPTTSSQKLTVNGVSQTFTAGTYKITETQLYDALIAMLQRAETDDAIKQTLAAFVEAAGAADLDAPSAEELQEELAKAIESGIQELEDAKADSDPNNYVELITYVDNKEQIRGYELRFYISGESGYDMIRWVAVKDGSVDQVEIVVQPKTGGSIMRITGQQSETNGAYNGTFQLAIDGQNLMSVELQNVKSSGDALSGSITLYPDASLLADITQGAQLPAGMLGDKLGLKLVFDIGHDSPKMEVHLIADGKTLVGVTYSLTTHEAADIKIPGASQIVDAETWASYLDPAALLLSLKNAGVPDEILQLLTSLPGVAA